MCGAEKKAVEEKLLQLIVRYHISRRSDEEKLKKMEYSSTKNSMLQSVEYV